MSKDRDHALIVWLLSVLPLTICSNVVCGRNDPTSTRTAASAPNNPAISRKSAPGSADGDADGGRGGCICGGPYGYGC